MKPPPFDYHAPRTLEEALGLLAALGNAKLLAGGQSLMPMLNMRFVQPDHVVDLNRVAGLAGIAVEGGALVVGAMARQRDIELSPDVRQAVPLLGDALAHVGHIQTRNRGTLGGSLCHLDPAAELPAVAMAQDAVIEVAGPRGRRSLAMADFPAFYMTPAIEPDEIVVAVRFPLWPAGHGHAFEEFARRHGDFALAAAGVLVARAADGTIARAAVVVAGLGAAPLRLAEAEALLTGARPEPERLSRVAALCLSLEANGDIHASADYRRHLAATLTARALARALGDGREAGRAA
ncbi:MAG: FAD binding domain-containing protein [Dongiaceae bacterium]